MNPQFEGQDIKVVYGATGRHDRFEFFYGGIMAPDGYGHGHVVSNDGENIHYWRLPDSEGGRVVVDNSLNFDQLRAHGVY